MKFILEGICVIMSGEGEIVYAGSIKNSPSVAGFQVHLHPVDFEKLKAGVLPANIDIVFRAISAMPWYADFKETTKFVNPPRNASFHRRLRSQIYVVRFDLGVECRRVHAEQTSGARLMSACLFERPANQIGFEFTHFIVKIHAA